MNSYNMHNKTLITRSRDKNHEIVIKKYIKVRYISFNLKHLMTKLYKKKNMISTYAYLICLSSHFYFVVCDMSIHMDITQTFLSV